MPAPLRTTAPIEAVIGEPVKIAYVVSQFPSLTETFIAREIQQVAQLGHGVTVCILRPQSAQSGPQGLRVPEALQVRVRLSPISLMAANLWALSSRPGVYLSIWGDTLLAALRKPARALHVLYDLIAAVWLARELQDQGAQYVHSHFLHNEAVTAMWLARLLRIPYGITAHVASMRLDRRLMRQVVRQAALLVGDTEQTLSVYQELARRQATLIRNGVDLTDLPVVYGESSHELVAPPLILAIGSLYHAKGFHVLVQACGLLRRRGVRFRCRIIGEGEERPNLERLIEEHQLQGLVELPGALTFDALRLQYRQATMLAMPSVPSKVGSDGLPTVLIEAMAQGIPVVATCYAGIPDLVRHDQTGLLAEPDNPDDLADCIQTCLSQSKMRMRLSAEGRTLVQQEYSLQVNSARLEGLFSQTISAQGKT